MNRNALPAFALKHVARTRSGQLSRLLCWTFCCPFIAIICAILNTEKENKIDYSENSWQPFDRFALTFTPLHSAVRPTQAPYAHRNEYAGQSFAIHATADSSLPSAQFTMPSHTSDDRMHSPSAHCFEYRPQFCASTTPVQWTNEKKTKRNDVNEGPKNNLSGGGRRDAVNPTVFIHFMLKTCLLLSLTRVLTTVNLFRRQILIALKLVVCDGITCFQWIQKRKKKKNRIESNEIVLTVNC